MRLCLSVAFALVAFLATSAQAQVQPEPVTGDGVCGAALQTLYMLNPLDPTVCTPAAFSGAVVEVSPAPTITPSATQTGVVASDDRNVATRLRVRVLIRQRTTGTGFTCTLQHRATQVNPRYINTTPPDFYTTTAPTLNVPVGTSSLPYDSGEYFIPAGQTIPIAAQIVCNNVPDVPGSQTRQFVARFDFAAPALVVGQASLSPSPAAAGVPVTATATLTALATDTFVLEKRAVGSTGAFATVTTTSTTYTTTAASATFTAASGDDNYEYRFVGTRAGMPATTVNGAVSAAHRVVSSGASGQTHASTVVGGTTMTFTVTGITGGATAATLWTVGAPDTQVTTAMCTVATGTATCTVQATTAHDNFQFRVVVTNGGASFSSTPTAIQRVVSAGNPSPAAPVIVAGGAQTLTATASGAGTITWQRRTGTNTWADYINAMSCPQVTTAGSQTVTCAVGNTAADDNFEYRVRSLLNTDESVSATPTLVRVVSAGTTTITHTTPIAQGQTMTFQVTAITGGATVATLRTTAPDAVVGAANCGTITGGAVTCTLVANALRDDTKLFRIAVANGGTNFITGTPTGAQQVVSTGATTTATTPVAAGGSMTFSTSGVTGGANAAALESSTASSGPTWSPVTATCAGTTCTVTSATAAQDNLHYRIVVANGAASFASATPAQHRVVSVTTPTADGGLVIASGTTRTLSAQGSGAGTLTWQRRTAGNMFADYVNTNCPSVTATGVQSVSCQVGNQASDDNYEYRLTASNGMVSQSSTTLTIRVVFTGATTTATTPVAAGGQMVFTTSGITGNANAATLESSSSAGGPYTGVTATCTPITGGGTTCTVASATAAQDNLHYRIVVANGMISFASATPVQHRVVFTGATTSDTNPILTGTTMTFRTTGITGGVTTGIVLQSAPGAGGPWNTAMGSTCPPIMATTTAAECTLTAAPTHDNQLFRIQVSTTVSFASATPVTQQVVSAGSPTPVSVRAIRVGDTQTLTVQASGAGGAGSGTIVWQRRTGGGAWQTAPAPCNNPITTAGNQAALTCTVTGALNEDNYEYRVRSSNGGVFQESSAPVLIRVVAITTQPVNKIIAENTAGNPMFSADGHGDGAFQWQYQKPGSTAWNAVAAGADFPTGLAGETTKQLTFTAGNNDFHNAWKFRLRIRNSQCGPCGDVDAFTNEVMLTVVAVMIDPANQVVVSGNPASYSFTGINYQSQRWQQYCPPYTAPVATGLTASGWSNMAPGQIAATLAVATSNANPTAMAGAGAKNGCLYRVVITNTNAMPNVESQSEPASLREVFYTMASTTLAHRAKYDYYATGSVLSAPFTEQQLPIAYSATNLQPISNRGVRSDQSCTLTLKYSTASGLGNAAVNTITSGNVLSQTFTLGTTTSPGATAITAVPGTGLTPNPTPNGLIGHTQARALNGGVLSLSCVTETGPYADSQPLTLYYPPLLSTAPFQRWSSTPTNFVTRLYVDFPEPGHWNYLEQQVARLEFLFDGHPTVIGVATTVTFNFKDAAGTVNSVAVGAPNANVPKATVTAPATSTVVVTGTSPVASALTIAPLTITEARENYHNKILSVTAAFTSPPADTTNAGAVNLGGFAGFSQLLFQPTEYALDAGVLSPHYPPVLITTEPLTSEETNFPDTGVYRWPTRVLFHGFPKHDSQFGNTAYSRRMAPAVSVFPKRNYNQKLEYRSHDGTVYRTVAAPSDGDRNYRDAIPTTGTIPQPAPTFTLVASTNPPIAGVFEANSVIPTATTTPLRLYNKWVYRWVLGVYRVDGTYEPYSQGRDQAQYLSYYGVSGGFLGIWNWYPREFVPALCPTVTGPFALGAVDQLVTPTVLSATMYPAPAAGVLAWDYAHHTANQWSLVDMTQASSTLTGGTTGMPFVTGESPLLPIVPGVNHLFKSSFNVIESTIPRVLPPVGVPDVIGYEVRCQGRINSILSSDANSIITPKYTHTLPDLLGNTKGQRTIRGFPNMVLTDNCKPLATLSTAANTATTVSHRGGETLVFDFPTGPRAGTVQVQIKDSQDGAAMFATAFSVTLIANQPATFQWTTRYKSNKTPVTVTDIRLDTAVTPAVIVRTHEYSNIPFNWPFTAAGTALPAMPANEALTQCVAPQTVANNANANLPALTQQYHGCGTATGATAPGNC